MDARRALLDLLAEHREAGFPPEVDKGRTYGIVDPVLIDADIFGWALTASSGRLNPDEQLRLVAAKDELSRSIETFPTDARGHYKRLVRLADAALRYAH